MYLRNWRHQIIIRNRELQTCANILYSGSRMNSTNERCDVLLGARFVNFRLLNEEQK